MNCHEKVGTVFAACCGLFVGVLIFLLSLLLFS